jgi:hypothetical protein
VGQLDVWSIIVGTLLPLTIIVVGLTTLNLEKAVFSLMGGLSEHTANDGAFATLWLLSVISILLFIPLLVIYVVLVVLKTTRRRTLHVLGNEND